MAESTEKKKYYGRMHGLQKQLMEQWYQKLNTLYENGGGAVYMMISGNPVELVRAFDLEPVYPEINALQLAIRKQALPALLKAEEVGYSTDNCGYVKADVGMFFLNQATSLGTRLPRPLLILCNFVGCNTYIKWFEHLAYWMDAPIYMLDIPFMRLPEPRKEDVAYVVHQLKEVIKILEEYTGKKLDEDRLKETLHYSAKMEELWSEVKNLSKNIPSPYDAYFDSTTMMGPLYVYRGTQEGVQFFEETVKEFREKVQNKVGTVPEEKFRVVTEGPPPYPYFRTLRDLLARWSAVAVASTYSTVGGIWEFGYRHNPEKPLESIALHMLAHNLPNRNYLQRYAQIRRYIDEWKADGLIIHAVKSCRLFSAGQGDMREYFTQQMNVPTLYIESDLEDPRYFSEAQIRNRIDAFFEALEHRKFYRGEKV
ncbi:MAG: 2-hydroxyacyl-CoA dehydratase subunit D [bacterium]